LILPDLNGLKANCDIESLRTFKRSKVLRGDDQEIKTYQEIKRVANAELNGWLRESYDDESEEWEERKQILLRFSELVDILAKVSNKLSLGVWT
jgi:hypothetical protein